MMRLLEVRDEFIKVEIPKNINLSSFLLIEDALKTYIAQVQQIKQAGENNIAYAKLIFLYNGNILDFDGSLPSINSTVAEFSLEDLNKGVNIQNPIIIGNFIQNNELIKMEKDCFDKETLIVIDSILNNQILIKNITEQLKKSLIIDASGIFKENKVFAGVDFKLPLNTSALQFIYEDCLTDATSDSKSLIKEIFQDLSNYSKEVDFIPFGVLKSIIDEMVEKKHIFKLLVLKNKLAKFDKLGYFASSIEEAKSLDKILSAQKNIIDLSNLDATFQNRYLEIILSQVEKSYSDTQIFVEASNLLNKKILKKIITGNCKTTFVASSKYKYLNEIKSMFKNFIIESNFLNKENFKNLSSLMNLLPKDAYLVINKNSKNIPLISYINEMNLSLGIDNTDETQEQPQILETENTFDESLTNENNNLNKNNSTIDVINEKSNELIQKVSCEIATENIPAELNLFDSENENEDVDVEEDLQEKEEEIIDYNNSDDAVFEELIPEIIEEVSEESSLTENELEEDFNSNIIEDNINDETVIEEENIVNDITELQEVEIIDLEVNNETPVEILTDDSTEEISEIIQEETDINIEDSQIIEMLDEISVEEINNNQVEDINEIDESIISLDTEYSFDEINTENTEIIAETTEIVTDEDNIENLVQNPDSENENFEIIELDDAEMNDIDVLVDLEEETEEYNLEKEIIEDVDKVFTTMKDDNEAISDTDLDFIDELNNVEKPISEMPEEVLLTEEFEEVEELIDIENNEKDLLLTPMEEVNDSISNALEEDAGILKTKSSSTPMVPIYEAEIPQEDLVNSDPIEQGDTVMHAKYGKGIVEKMVKYGTKTLYSINFQSSGRTLLDPTITEIKKC